MFPKRRLTLSTKDFSSIQEAAVSDYLGWDVVSGSGSRPCCPGDIICDEWLGECKTHVEPGKPISFLASFWKKICAEADMRHRMPALFVDDGTQKLDHTWVVCRLCNTTQLSEYTSTVSFPYKISTNITFNHGDLVGDVAGYKALLGQSMIVIMSADWGKCGKVAVMRLSDFKEMNQLC